MDFLLRISCGMQHGSLMNLPFLLSRPGQGCTLSQAFDYEAYEPSLSFTIPVFPLRCSEPCTDPLFPLFLMQPTTSLPSPQFRMEIAFASSLVARATLWECNFLSHHNPRKRKFKIQQLLCCFYLFYHLFTNSHNI